MLNPRDIPVRLQILNQFGHKQASHLRARCQFRHGAAGADELGHVPVRGSQVAEASLGHAAVDTRVDRHEQIADERSDVVDGGAATWFCGVDMRRIAASRKQPLLVPRSDA